MLVLSRKLSESIRIGEVVVKVLRIRGNRVLVGIDAPREVVILRAELEAKSPAIHVSVPKEDERQ